MDLVVIYVHRFQALDITNYLLFLNLEMPVHAGNFLPLIPKKGSHSDFTVTQKIASHAPFSLLQVTNPNLPPL